MTTIPYDDTVLDFAPVEVPTVEASTVDEVGRPRWARPCLIALLAGTALLYLWGLGASGWANGFYSAAAQAGSRSWKAFFFGSFDSSNAITVDKPPASMWVMSLSVRLFGLNAWSILVPQAIEGVAAVFVLYATVKRWFGHAAGLLAGLVLALTPISVLMFRFNNPDALLVLLLVGSAYAMVRAVEHAQTRWLLLAAALIGFAFLTKMLQAFLVVPGFIAVYLIAAPTPMLRRLWQLAVAAIALVVSSLWWVVVVMAVPAASRPYIGGSQTNSLWDLIFGYNGFGRLTGNETGSVGAGGPGTGIWGPTGWTRMFNAEFGGQISWLLPAALLLLAAGLVYTVRRARTDRLRAALVLWGSWLVVTGIVFSLSRGIIHPYYTVALAPPIAAIVGIGVVHLWRLRDAFAARTALAALLVITAYWSSVLLGRADGWQTWLAPAVLIAAVSLGVGLLVARDARGASALVLGACALVVALAGSAAFGVATAATTHAGALPVAGPASAAFGPGGGGFPFPGRFGGGGRAFRGFNGGAPPFAGNLPRSFGGNGGPRGGGGNLGGLLETSAPSADLVQLLERNADRYTWVAATVGSNSAAGYQLATQQPIMSIGGFNGTDPSPTLAQFQADVAAGKIHYFIGGGGPGGFGGGGRFGSDAGTSSAIASWVEQHFTSTTVGGVTVYDLTNPSS
jgi:4-amino-4-deoxy-L-arabinose transferase-like glycosyltransferase